MIYEKNPCNILSRKLDKYFVIKLIIGITHELRTNPVQYGASQMYMVHTICVEGLFKVKDKSVMESVTG